MKTPWFFVAVCGSALSLAGCSTARHPSCCEPSAAVAASMALKAARDSASEELFVTPWLWTGERPTLALDYRVTTHDGTITTLRELLDRPAAISFAYSRCENPNKCPRVVSTMGMLHDELQRIGLLGRVRLLLITYDPAYDTPVVLRGFAKFNGLRLDEHALFLRPEIDQEHGLFRELRTNTAFNEGGVAIHGIQLLILDKHGRLARTYRTLVWDNAQVLADLKALAAE